MFCVDVLFTLDLPTYASHQRGARGRRCLSRPFSLRSLLVPRPEVNAAAAKEASPTNRVKNYNRFNGLFGVAMILIAAENIYVLRNSTGETVHRSSGPVDPQFRANPWYSRCGCAGQPQSQLPRRRCGHPGDRGVLWRSQGLFQRTYRVAVQGRGVEGFSQTAR